LAAPSRFDERAPPKRAWDFLQRKEVTSMKELKLHVEELEARIAPSVNGTGGYDGQPGNQSSSQGNPSGSANPENSHH
jgi:hypothetical protein